jgi:hypothetical protein
MPEWLKRLTKSDIRNSLSIIIVLGCFTLMILLISVKIPTENHDIVLTLGGVIIGGYLGGVTGYYYSSTKADKNHKNED